MQIRHSTEEDLPVMLHIYGHARQFQAEHGNPHQWGDNHWPPEEMLHADIRAGKSYVVVHEGSVVGTFYYDFGTEIEPTYRVIEDGDWQDASPYGVVHRLAGDGSVRGIGKAVLDFAKEKSMGHVRVDTHPDNKVLQTLLPEQGFVLCGTIHVVQDPDPRLAYEFSQKG